MKYIFATIACAALLVSASATGSAADDLLARMAAVNANLHSYTVNMKAHVALTTFPFLSADLLGTYYHKDPDRDKLEITSGLPAIASQFSKLYPHLEPPSRWTTVFDVKLLSDDGKTTTFKLTPKAQGNVASIEAKVDDVQATVRALQWNYTDGATATMDNTYQQVHGYLLVTSQTGSVNEPSYKGTVSSQLFDYKLNPQIADTVFQQ
jgi:outer membrane lipoprotein-sorting protein